MYLSGREEERIGQGKKGDNKREGEEERRDKQRDRDDRGIERQK